MASRPAIAVALPHPTARHLTGLLFCAIAVGTALPWTASGQPAAPVAPEPPPATPGAAAPAGALTRAPALTWFVEAEYPPEALAAGVEGAVLLSVVVDAEGNVTQVAVLDPGPHPGFGPAALHAVAQFQFSPAEIDGKPAAVEITYRYQFTIRREAPPPPAEAPVAIRGRVLERGTRSPVADAVVDAGAASATTGPDGRFELRGLPSGPVQLAVFSPSHQPGRAGVAVREGEVAEVEIRITRRHDDPYQAVVQGERDRPDVTVRTLRPEELRTVPGTQGDVLKVIQDLPGVSRAPWGLGLLVVRGSAPQDTRFYVDGVEIPLLFHFGGLVSVVASEALAGLDFYPGDFGVRFGRALGGTVEAHTKDARREWHGLAQLDVAGGQIAAEMPAGRGSFSLGFRRSWIDAVLALALPRLAPDAANDLRVAPRYYDYQMKLSHPALSGEASLTFYGSYDKLLYAQDSDPADRPSLDYQTFFHRLAGHWRRSLGPDLRNDLTLALGFDRFKLLQASNLGVNSDVWSATLRDRLAWRLSDSLSLEAGADAILRHFTYSVFAPPYPPPGTVGGFENPDTGTQLGETAAGSWISPAIYLEAGWRPLDRVRIVPGLRLDADSRLSTKGVWLDPRLAAFFDAGPGTVLSAAAGLYGEAPQPQQTTKTLGNPSLGPQRSLQLSLGLTQQLPWASRLEATVFWKKMWDLVTQTRAVGADGRPLFFSNEGLGRVLGLELLLRRELAQGLFGWIAYTLSLSERRDDPTVPSYPAWHPAPFDQTHNLTLVLSWRLPGEWILGTRVRAVTGSPVTPIEGAAYDADTGGYQCLLSPRPFSARVPPFFQADVRVDKRWTFDRWMFSAYLDVQNVTNRSNAEFRVPSYDCGAQAPLPGIPIFPTLGLRAEW
ncbi:MAG TPA: TonB-dependent receptor [Anaeromyxobacteraceae bacterium]|nr:TonB-dependent receptor [Anaeromyxobacteraceae bacterium]